MTIVFLIIIAIVAYVFGSLNTQTVASVFVFHSDLHKLGKGSLWLSNFRRIYGTGNLVKLLIIEVIKDLLPILLGGWLMGTKDYALLGKAFAGFCLVLGNLFPVFNRYKGEHGIFPVIIMAFCIDISAGALVLIVSLFSLWLHRYVTVTSVVTGIAIAVAGVLVLDDPMPTRLCAFVGGLVFIRHIPGIINMLRGREKRLSLEQDLNYKFDETFDNK